MSYSYFSVVKVQCVSTFVRTREFWKNAKQGNKNSFINRKYELITDLTFYISENLKMSLSNNAAYIIMMM